MALTLDEMIELIPEFENLSKVLVSSLKKDSNGKINITNAEAKVLAKLITRLSIKLSKEAID